MVLEKAKIGQLKGIRNTRNLPIASVLLILSALHFYSLGVLRVGEIKIAPWDIVTLVLALWWMMVMIRTPIRLDRYFLISLVCLIIFSLWVGIEALRSPQEGRGLTMFVQQIRNLIIFIIVGTSLRLLKDFRQLNMVVFALGAVIALISVPLFAASIRNLPTILVTPSLWYPEIGYTLSQGIPRLKGFAGDPNFYSIWISISLFTGINNAPKSYSKLVLIATIGLSILLAASRTLLIMLIFSIVILVIIIAFSRRERPSLAKYLKVMLPGTFLVIGAGFLWSILESNVWGELAKRFQLTASAPRFEMWRLLIERGLDNVFFGKGLRGAEELLSGTYSHNSYLDLLVETGLIGFLIWSFFAFIVTSCALRRIDEQSLIPWVQCWILLIGVLAAFSLIYSPFLWVVAAVILSCPSTRENNARH
ncbi:MAG: O-antigen ligase family protein [Candidatus Nitrosotenuis sp.]